MGLIVAIGAQNAWVLSQAMRGSNKVIMASICISCDTLLIALGVYGMQYVQQIAPLLTPILTWLGVTLLLWLAWQSARRAWQGTSTLLTEHAVPTLNGWKLAATALAITLLNPHVYLDTVVLIGSVGAQQINPTLFTLGACLASFTWFTALTSLAPWLAKWLRSPLRWRIFDSSMAGLLLIVAASLVSSA
jgi:L-lysine exporter family protein LysE/ArgO